MKDPPTREQMRELIDWVARRPPNVVAVMDKIPPASYVQAKKGKALLCPAPGVTGQVTQYDEDEDGRVSVRVTDGLWNASCDPDWLVVVDSEDQRQLYEAAKAGQEVIE